MLDRTNNQNCIYETHLVNTPPAARHDAQLQSRYIPLMKFPPSILDDIKARLPASTVVGRRVRLTKAGRE